MTTPNPNVPQAAAPNQSAGAKSGNEPPKTTRMGLSQAYTYNGVTYGPGDANVPEGDAATAIQQKEDDYNRYLAEGGQPLPPVTPATGDNPHYDHRLRRPGNVPPPREVLQVQGRGADVPASKEQVDAAAKEAADRAGDEDRPARRAGTAMDTAGQRQTVRESANADDSPVSDSNAAEAVEQISHMRARDKLQAIADNDKRATVKAAAQKRLSEL